jgi:hypothetical protein
MSFSDDCADAPFTKAETPERLTITTADGEEVLVINFATDAHDAEEREPTDSKAEGQTMNDDDRDQETPDTGHEQRTGAASPEPTPAPWGSFTWGHEPWATPEEAAK